MSKSIITKYEQYSVFSGSPATCQHHLIYGKYGSLRTKADKAGLWIPLTDSEHNMSSTGTINQIHDNPAAEKLSKILGEVAWERQYLAKKLANVNKEGLDEKSIEDWIDESRGAFRKEFGENFI